MRTARLGVLAALFTMAQAVTLTQSSAPPTAAIDITDEQIKKVNSSPGVDRQLRIVDMGEYNLAVGIVHRGATGQGGAGRGGAGRGGAGGGAGAAAPRVPCGGTATAGATSGVSGIAHDATTETYIIVSGSGTLVTGGRIVNGARSAPESPVTTILNGPSCSGPIEGDIVRRVVKTGDVIIIPANVPHGWTDIADHVDYLSVRPDPDKVLQAGYVHPLIAQ